MMAQINKMDSKAKAAIGGTVLGVPVLAILLFVAKASMATGALTNQVGDLEQVVKKDHEPRLRCVEMTMVEQQAYQREMMRILEEMKEDLKFLRNQKTR